MVMLPIAMSFPLLTLPCAAPVNTTVACQLAGYGFAGHERVAITYHVNVRTPSNGTRLTTYVRSTVTDAQGNFVRPVLRFAVEPRVLAYSVTVVAQGARGDRGEVQTFGTP